METLSIETQLTRTDVSRARWSWYLGTPFGKGATALLVVAACVTALGEVLGNRDMVLSWRPVLIALAILPLAVAAGGIRSPAIARLLEGPVRYGVAPVSWTHILC
jgi:hypothetical protein